MKPMQRYSPTKQIDTPAQIRSVHLSLKAFAPMSPTPLPRRIRRSRKHKQTRGRFSQLSSPLRFVRGGGDVRIFRKTPKKCSRQNGGNGYPKNIIVDTRQILLTDRIKEAVTKYDPAKDFSSFHDIRVKHITDEMARRRAHGYPLNRMEPIMSESGIVDGMMDSNLDFDALLQNEPIQLETVRIKEGESRKYEDIGKPVGVSIDGKQRIAYNIINGRHRLARAIIQDRKTINAQIVS